MTVLYIITFLLIVVIILLAMALYGFSKKSLYLSKNEKEFIIFAIDMYIQYAEELEINSETQHKTIIVQLKNIKQKYLE